jgi:uncharacterized protein involved in cysteine biosynthesis
MFQKIKNSNAPTWRLFLYVILKISLIYSLVRLLFYQYRSIIEYWNNQITPFDLLDRVIYWIGLISLFVVIDHYNQKLI